MRRCSRESVSLAGAAFRCRRPRRQEPGRERRRGLRKGSGKCSCSAHASCLFLLCAFSARFSRIPSTPCPLTPLGEDKQIFQLFGAVLSLFSLEDTPGLLRPVPLTALSRTAESASQHAGGPGLR